MKAEPIKTYPKNEGPRERLLAKGAEHLTDTELLAIILRVGRGTFKKGEAGESSLSFARELLKTFKGFQGLDRAHIEDLLAVPGLGLAKVAQIKAAIEIGKRLHTKKLPAKSFESSSAVASHFRPRFAQARHESVIVLLLNGQNQRIEEKVIAEGTAAESTIYIRRALEEALKASADSLVLVHNHPSGHTDPSPEDDETTRHLNKGARVLGLLLLDHVIVGPQSHYSYADSGRLEELRKVWRLNALWATRFAGSWANSLPPAPSWISWSNSLIPGREN